MKSLWYISALLMGFGLACNSYALPADPWAVQSQDYLQENDATVDEETDSWTDKLSAWKEEMFDNAVDSKAAVDAEFDALVDRLDAQKSSDIQTSDMAFGKLKKEKTSSSSFQFDFSDLWDKFVGKLSAMWDWFCDLLDGFAQKCLNWANSGMQRLSSETISIKNELSGAVKDLTR